MIRRLALSVALALTAAPAIAAPDEVVIEGRRYSREQASALSHDFVRRLGQLPDDGSGQYARWNRPICVGVIGVASTYAAIVKQRIEATAREAGAPVARTKCRTNLLVAFTGDSRRLLGDWYKDYPSRLFASADGRTKRAALEVDLPVRWIYGVRSGNPSQDGDILSGNETLAVALTNGQNVPTFGGA
jgi:hypothetical protein